MINKPNGRTIDPRSPELPRIIICVLMTYERHGWPHPKILDFFYSLLSNKNYATAYVYAHNFIPAASARNFIGRQVKDSGASWVMMLDNDMSPPLNVLDTIKDAPEDAAVVVPQFHIWHPDQNEAKGHTTLGWGGLEEYVKDAANGIVEPDRVFYEITKCGTGCIFIRPEVFQKVPPLWFEYRYGQDGALSATEDIVFCEKVRAAGLKIYGNAAIEVGHHHTVNLLTVAKSLHSKDIDFQKGSCANTSVPEIAERPSDESSVVAAV